MGWLTGYLHRTALHITAGVGASTDFQYPVKVYAGAGTNGSEAIGGLTGSKIYVGSKCTASFSNIAFTQGDGTTEIDHWGEPAVAGVSRIFWVKTPNATVDQTLNFYFGGDSGSKSNQANTFVDVITGVVGAWNMEEALATDALIDYSGNTNNGVPVGTTVVNGPFINRNARLLDGVADSITIASSAALKPTSAISIYMWLQHVTGIANWTRGLEKTGQFQETRAGGDIHYGEVSVDGAMREPGNRSAITKDVWFTYALTYAAATRTINAYKDSVAEAPNALGGLGGYDLDVTNNALVLALAGFKTKMCNLIIANVVFTQTQITNMQTNYPDVSLVAGSVLVRKYASTTNPAHSSWSSEENYETSAPVTPTGPPAPTPPIPISVILRIYDWLASRVAE